MKWKFQNWSYELQARRGLVPRLDRQNSLGTRPVEVSWLGNPRMSGLVGYSDSSTSGSEEEEEEEGEGDEEEEGKHEGGSPPPRKKPRPDPDNSRDPLPLPPAILEMFHEGTF